MKFITNSRNLNLRMRLCEMQGHRCAICTHRISMWRPPNDKFRPALAKIDRQENHSYQNSVALCAYCVGVSANFPSLMEFYDNYQNNAHRKPEKEKIIYPETRPEIYEKLKILFDEAGIRPHYTINDVPKGFQHAPSEMIDKIVASLFHTERGRKPRTSNRKKVSFTYIRGATNKEVKRDYAERTQNNKCYYCEHEMVYEPLTSPRFATWEHKIDRKYNGTNDERNIVVACRICNGLRENMRLSSDDFLAWARNHKGEIEHRVNRITKHNTIKAKFEEYVDYY